MTDSGPANAAKPKSLKVCWRHEDADAPWRGHTFVGICELRCGWSTENSQIGLSHPRKLFE